MESSARVVPAARSDRPTSLTVALPSAILSTDRALWRVRSLRLYADPQVRRYRVYATLEPHQADPLEDSGVTLELVGEGRNLLEAAAGLLHELFTSPTLVATPLEDEPPAPAPNIGYGMPGQFGAPDGGR